MNNEQLGFDPTIQQSKDGKRYINISRAGKIERLVVEKEITKRAVIVGRATTCWLCYQDDSTEPLVVKDSWQYMERPQEGELIQQATEKGVCNIARYYHHETVEINQEVDDVFANVRRGLEPAGGRTSFGEKSIVGSQATAWTSQNNTESSQSRPQQKSRKRAPSPGPPTSHPSKKCHLNSSRQDSEFRNDNRVHRRVVTRGLGKPIKQASSCLAIIKGFIGAISGESAGMGVDDPLLTLYGA